MNWTIEPMPTRGPRFVGAIGVYGAAFAEPPYSDDDRGDEVRNRLQDLHSRRPGYHAFAALDAGGAVLGMCYGYRGDRGQWWHDTVTKQLSREQAVRWMSDSYELVEVAVAPRLQGSGIGRALIERLLENRPEATCVLSTRTDSRAHHLYSRMGFEVVKEMPFHPGGALFYVMGKDLGGLSQRAD
jgi:ribosomal protein S18 acetylase RimI-like enzyme